MATETLEAGAESAKVHSHDAVEILDELGVHIGQIATLLRAAELTTSQRDTHRLVDMALMEAELLERRHNELATGKETRQ